MKTHTLSYLALAVSLACLPAQAQQFAPAAPSPVYLDIAAQPLVDALNQLASQAGLQLLLDAGVSEQNSLAQRISGRFTPEAALRRLLVNSKLKYEFVDERTVAIHGNASLTMQGENGSLLRTLAGRSEELQPEAGEGFSYRNIRLAQSDGAEQGGLEEVVVTGAKRKFAPPDSSVATKIPMDIIDTPQALSVVSSELMSMVGVSSVATAAALTPGIVDQSTEIPMFQTVTIRGIAVDGGRSNTINGLPMNVSSGSIAMDVADRLEVARGPASVIYGQTNYGGTMNVALKMPQSKPAFAGGLGYGIDGAYRAVADVTGALSESGRLRGRLITVYDDVKTPQDLSYLRDTSIAPSLSWDLADNTTLDINLFHSRSARRRTDGFSLQQQADGSLAVPSISRSVFLGADYSRTHATEDFGIAKLTHRFSDDWVLEGSVGAAKTHHDLNESFPSGDLVSVNGEMPLIALAVVQDISDKVGDLTLRGNFDAFGRTHTLMLGGSYHRNRNAYIGACCESLGSINVFDPDTSAFSNPYADFPDNLSDRASPPAGLGFNFRGISTEKAISSMLLLHPLERLSVMAGLRYSDYQSIGTDFYDHSISYQFPEDFKTNATEKRLGVVYELAKDFNVYASYATGVLFNTSVQFSGGALPPESGEQWEVGAKAALLGRKLTLSAAAFQLDRNNVATGDPNHPNTPYVIGINGQKHKGFEIEAIGEPVPGWNLIASYSYLDVKVDFCVEVDGVCTDPFGWNGQQLASSPHDMVKLYTNYQMQGGPLNGVTFGGGVFYAGKREVDNAGTFQVPAYTRVDLRLGYDALEKVSFSLNAINVTDEDVYVVQQASSSGSLDYGNRRTLLFRVDFKY